MTKATCFTTLAMLFALGCSEAPGGSGGSGGTGGAADAVFVDAEWNLTCPADSAVDCGTLAPQTCLGDLGQRSFVGEHGQLACTGHPISAICEAIERADGARIVTLEANVGDEFAFELQAADVDADGIVVQTACNVTIIEDGVPYDMGTCGQNAPSLEQPCQLSNVSVEGHEVVFDVQCNSILSSVTALSFDAGALGGGPTTIRFANCIGF